MSPGIRERLTISRLLRLLRGRVPAGAAPRGRRGPDDPDAGGPPGGVREPRRPHPSTPSAAATAPEPAPPVIAHDRMEPPPEEMSTPQR
ncbi:MAG TPA: hypothetical protein VGL93_09280 [Streptosporangiaceae bacterium]|jgi:hypothetical protein